MRPQGRTQVDLVHGITTEAEQSQATYAWGVLAAAHVCTLEGTLHTISTNVNKSKSTSFNRTKDVYALPDTAALVFSFSESQPTSNIFARSICSDTPSNCAISYCNKLLL